MSIIGKEVLNLNDMNWYYAIQYTPGDPNTLEDGLLSIALSLADAMAPIPISIDLLTDDEFKWAENVQVCPFCGSPKITADAAVGVNKVNVEIKKTKQCSDCHEKFENPITRQTFKKQQQ